MLKCCHFGLHFTHAHVASFAARLVKEVNYSPRQAAEKYYQEPHCADELGNRDRGMANVVQHDLQDLLAQTETSEANRQAVIVRSIGKTAKKSSTFTPSGNAEGTSNA